MVQNISFISLFFLFFISCGETPSGILPHNKMQLVYWDIIVANAMTEEVISRDSTKNASVENAKMQQQVFAMHQTDRKQFYKSLEYYKEHPELMNRLLDSMVSRANKERYSPANLVNPIGSDTSALKQVQRVRPVTDKLKEE